MILSQSASLPFSQLNQLQAYQGNRFFYPGVEQLMEPGDIIYSSKGLSTFFVGHVGIVGPDYLIYHSHPKGGFADRLPNYLSRHRFGSRLTILRPGRGANAAAEWASAHVIEISHYIFNRSLQNIRWNYCSKYIWQAFWYTGFGDITSRGLTDKRITWIYPMEIKKSALISKKIEIELGSKKGKQRAVK